MVRELTHWDNCFNKILSFFLYESSILYLPLVSTNCPNIILDINSFGNEFILSYYVCRVPSSVLFHWGKKTTQGQVLLK